MNESRKSSHNKDENPKQGRINLNDPNRQEEVNALKDHSDETVKTVDRNLNEQMGGTDNTVTSKPNHI